MERLAIDSCASNGRGRFEYVRKYTGCDRLDFGCEILKRRGDRLDVLSQRNSIIALGALDNGLLEQCNFSVDVFRIVYRLPASGAQAQI